MYSLVLPLERSCQGKPKEKMSINTVGTHSMFVWLELKGLDSPDLDGRNLQPMASERIPIL